MRLSVVIPTRSGGPALLRTLEMVARQRGVADTEVIVVDSGSSQAELDAVRRFDVRVESIPPAEFDHGATRDLGARLARGGIVAFLNQDATPCDEEWLRRLCEPFAARPELAAVQGGIREWPEPTPLADRPRRFFWDSCGPRFYFTRESRDWIARHGGLGFSTVNCAIARWALLAEPFGRIAILEDKAWQQRAAHRGWPIAEAPEAAVWHTHDYDLRGLLRRCASEGYGWRLVGERYALRMALRDLGNPPTWREWRRGLRAGELSSWAERLFPIARPLALWWGNRWATRVLHG